MNRYDDFAAAYAEDNETNAWNACYERPGTLALAGNVRGLRVLDAGCGSGALAAALAGGGAAVTGIDLSAGLLEIAGLARRLLFARLTWGNHSHSLMGRSSWSWRRWCCTTWKTGCLPCPSFTACWSRLAGS